ncbi:MAG TPA: PspC domain-containing protein, partial [Solirubrobacteraceae bacterium]
MDTDTTPTEPQNPEPRRLTRSTEDRVIGGVCGGLGRYFSIDPVIFRIAAVALVVIGGAGILLYLAAWLLVPPDGAGPLGEDRRRRGLAVVGAGLLVVGASIALSHGPFGWWPWP